MSNDQREETDIFTLYFDYVSDTEPPISYHRWCLLSGVATLLGRKVYTKFGMFNIYPNLYITLVGEPASRKSTSIKILKQLLSKAGYDSFAADKTSKEKFLLDLEGYIDPNESAGNGNSGKNFLLSSDVSTDLNLWGEGEHGEPKEVYIAADEFSEFTGFGNLDFYTTLGSLWDWDSPEKSFVQRLKNSRSVSIYQPTINILSGTTSELFSKIFPQEAIGSGFLSRLLLIYGERSGRKIPFPSPPDEQLESRIISLLNKIANFHQGEITVSSAAKLVMSEIYLEKAEIEDSRFKAYSNRSFTQLLKICLILTLSRFEKEIAPETVLKAHTILSHAEILMPKAIGEYGKNKDSAVASAILQRLEGSIIPITPRDLYKYVARDCSRDSMMTILGNLVQADKIQPVKLGSVMGYLLKRAPRIDPPHTDWSLISQEERDMIGVIPLLKK